MILVDAPILHLEKRIFQSIGLASTYQFVNNNNNNNINGQSHNGHHHNNNKNCEPKTELLTINQIDNL